MNIPIEQLLTSLKEIVDRSGMKSIVALAFGGGIVLITFSSIGSFLAHSSGPMMISRPLSIKVIPISERLVTSSSDILL